MAIETIADEIHAPNASRTTLTKKPKRAVRRMSVGGAVAALVVGLMIPIGAAAPAQAAGSATCSSFGWSGANIIGSCSNKSFQVMWQCFPSKKWNYKTLGGPFGLSFNFKACDVTWVTDAQAVI